MMKWSTFVNDKLLEVKPNLQWIMKHYHPRFVGERWHSNRLSCCQEGARCWCKAWEPLCPGCRGTTCWPASCSPLEGETEWNPKGLRCWKPAPIPSSTSDSVGSLPVPPQPSAARRAGLWSQHLRCPCSYFASCLFFNSCFLPWDTLLGQSSSKFLVWGILWVFQRAMHMLCTLAPSVSTPSAHLMQSACPDGLRQRLPGNLSAIATKNQSFSDEVF